MMRPLAVALLLMALLPGCSGDKTQQAEDYGYRLCVCMGEFAQNPTDSARKVYDNCMAVTMKQMDEFLAEIADPLEREPLSHTARSIYKACYEEHKAVLEGQFNKPAAGGTAKVDVSAIKEVNKWLGEYEAHVAQYLKLRAAVEANPDDAQAFDAFSTYDTQVHQTYEQQAAALYDALKPDQRQRLDALRNKLKGK